MGTPTPIREDPKIVCEQPKPICEYPKAVWEQLTRVWEGDFEAWRCWRGTRRDSRTQAERCSWHMKVPSPSPCARKRARPRPPVGLRYAHFRRCATVSRPSAPTDHAEGSQVLSTVGRRSGVASYGAARSGDRRRTANISRSRVKMCVTIRSPARSRVGVAGGPR